MGPRVGEYSLYAVWNHSVEQLVAAGRLGTLMRRVDGGATEPEIPGEGRKALVRVQSAVAVPHLPDLTSQKGR